jgi:3-deoxy-D-manno-octulosonic-acid transferase
VSYFLYNLVLTVAFVLALPFLPALWLLGERFRTGLFQRMGFYSRTVKQEVAGARSLWVHAASVGEVICAARLIEELKKRFPERKIIISTFTNTGLQTARQATRADVVIFLPLDLLWTVRRAFTVLDPSLLIVLETEIWPNLLCEAYRRGVPSLLLSGRISGRAFSRYSLFRSFFKKVTQNFTAVGMQTDEDARRIMSLGARRERISITGSLKRAMRETAGDPSNREPDGNRVTPKKPILVVGSSHRGEEEALVDAFVSLRRSFPDLQMVLAPRHPQRFWEVEKLLRARGMDYQRRSQGNGRLYFEKDILFLDTVGDLMDFYAIGDIAFVGGTLVDAGGHNLLEPARFRKPVLFGPFTANFAEVAAEMKSKGGGIEVQGTEELVAQISDLLSNPEKCKAIGEKAYQIATDDGQVVENSMELICRYAPARRP